jgi:hypothetical protein
VGAGPASLEDLVKVPPVFSGQTLEQLISINITNNGVQSPSCRTCNVKWTVAVEPKHLRAVYRSFSSEERAKNDWNMWFKRICKHFPDPACGHVHPNAGSMEGGTFYWTIRHHGWHSYWHNLMRDSKPAIDQLEAIEQSRFIFSLVRSHRRCLTSHSLQGTYAVSLIFVATSSALRTTDVSPRPTATHVQRAATTRAGGLQRGGAGAQPGGGHARLAAA